MAKLLNSILFLTFISFWAISQPLHVKRATDLCNPDSVVIGRLCPSFTGVDLSGLTIPISSLRGSYLCIMIWATSTNSSLREYPYFLKLKEKFKNITFLDISIDKDKQDWELYFHQNPILGLHWFADPLKAPLSFFLLKRKDRGEHTFFSYNIPQYILLNAEGKILENKIPFPPSDSIRFENLLRALPTKSKK